MNEWSDIKCQLVPVRLMVLRSVFGVALNDQETQHPEDYNHLKLFKLLYLGTDNTQFVVRYREFRYFSTIDPIFSYGFY